MDATTIRFFSGAIFILAFVLLSVTDWSDRVAQGQEVRAD